MSTPVRAGDKFAAKGNEMKIATFQLISRLLKQSAFAAGDFVEKSNQRLSIGASCFVLLRPDDGPTPKPP
jgi:hypothetical protein